MTLIKSIPDFPNKGRIVPEYIDKNLRELIYKNYRIVYRIKNDIIEIVAICHGSKPSYFYSYGKKPFIYFMKLKTYDLFPAFFSFIIDNKLRSLVENMERNVEIMGVKRGMKVLEAGCGSGFVTPALSKAVEKEGFVISVHIQKKMTEKAKRKRGYLRNVDFRVSSISDLSSIEDGGIDLAFLYYSFHEINNKEEAVAELRRVLKPNGILSIKEPRLEVFRKDRESYKEFITGHGFAAAESRKDCDLLGCYLQFVKR